MENVWKAIRLLTVKTECFPNVYRTEVNISPRLGTCIFRLHAGSEKNVLWFHGGSENVFLWFHGGSENVFLCFQGGSETILLWFQGGSETILLWFQGGSENVFLGGFINVP